MHAENKAFELIINAVRKRQSIKDTTDAFRLFNGFCEGLPGLVIDRYATALIFFDHHEPGALKTVIDEAKGWALATLPGLKTLLYKGRQQTNDQIKQGLLLAGDTLPDQISEFDVHYALDLRLHQDASFYLDTRYLRRWLSQNMRGKRILNTFAYTGSLGVACGVGGASSVVQTDLNNQYLHIAQRSWSLNDLPSEKCQLIAGDFFRVLGCMRHEEHLFDCVILDPPFFSTTDAGRVDLLGETTRLVNKVRPLVAHEGWLVLINNALFLSGEAFMAELDRLCQSKYLTFECMIPIPIDVTGYPETFITQPPANPAPFNHPTKIAILKVIRKDERT